jgi:hypothetical protein
MAPRAENATARVAIMTMSSLAKISRPVCTRLGIREAGCLRPASRTAGTETRRARQRRGPSYHRPLALVPVVLPSLHHTTGRTSLKRYDRGYEEEFYKGCSLPMIAREMVVATRLWRCRGTSYFTAFSVDSEYIL